MNKKEQAEIEELRNQLRIAKAFRFTEKVEPDVPIPELFSRELSKGFSFNSYTGEISRACSSSISHSVHNDEKTTTQCPRCLYSTRTLALKAMRYEMEQRFAKELADVDKQIEQELMLE